MSADSERERQSWSVALQKTRAGLPRQSVQNNMPESSHNKDANNQRQSAESATDLLGTLLPLLVRNSSDTLMVLGVDRRMRFVSPSVEKNLGYAPEELSGRNLFNFIHNEDLPDLERSYRSMLRTPQSETTLEYRFRHSDGHWVYLESVATNYADDERINGVVLNSRDVSERYEIQKELLRARYLAEDTFRVKTALLANISHEMRTPLTGILGFSSILEMDLPEGDARDMATKIHSSGARLLQTIEAILDLANLEAEKIDTAMERHDLVAEVYRAFRELEPLANQRQLRYRYLRPPKPLMVTFDRQFLNRVLYNIISNAFKYTEQGEITVKVSSSRRAGKQVGVIEVSDTGIGISVEFLPRVFDEFQQESTGHGRNYEGTGLGLTIAKKLVDKMGGTIKAKSKKGQGSTFRIELPVDIDTDSDPHLELDHEVEQAEGGAADSAESTPGSGQKRILVVDNDYDSLLIVKFYLSKLYKVDLAETGESALEMLQEMSYDMVIMDISLGPGIDGLSTLKIMRSISSLVRLPVLALTANAFAGDADFYIREGFSDFLLKPFKKNELMQVVGRLVENYS